MLGQELYGTAEAAVEGDNLDVTMAEEPSHDDHKDEHVHEHADEHTEEHKDDAVANIGMYVNYESVNMFQKLTFFGVIIAVVGIYIRMRSRSSHAGPRFPV